MAGGFLLPVGAAPDVAAGGTNRGGIGGGKGGGEGLFDAETSRASCLKLRFLRTIGDAM